MGSSTEPEWLFSTGTQTKWDKKNEESVNESQASTSQGGGEERIERQHLSPSLIMPRHRDKFFSYFEGQHLPHAPEPSAVREASL